MTLHRRYFLSAGAALAVLGSSPSLAAAFALPRAVPVVRTRRGRPVLVVVFLRGGADGLNLVVPYGDPDYARLRQWMAVAPPGGDGGALDLDGFFGLHPAAAPLAPLFADGRAAALHAVGSPANSRSHFEEQDVWETGVIEDVMNAEGWLARHLATTEGHGPVRAVSVGDALPRMLRGGASALALPSLDAISFRGSESTESALRRAYAAAGRSTPEASALAGRVGIDTLAALRPLQEVARQDAGGGVYPQTELGARLRDVARLVKGDVGLELAVVDAGGWDTHQDQGALGGTFARLVGGVAGGVAAFCEDLDDRLDDVLVVTVTEFGRTASLNGTGGTDHGWASCLLAAGGGAARARAAGGAPVLGAWPGLSREQRHQGRDLALTTDFRDVLTEIVRGHLGHPEPDLVIPRCPGATVGLID